MTDCRLIVDSPRSGAENMAIDEALLLSAASGSTPALRFYRWSEPTLSLGYFQAYKDRDSHPPSAPCTCVRRHSGGGAIVHDHELTYSLIIPVSDRWSPAADDLYQKVHSALIECYAEFGVAATLSSDGDKQPFLCFQRRSDGDIVVGDHKVTGSAQRRHRGALLQHGSILVERSDHAPELPGLREAGSIAVDDELFTKTAAEKIGRQLSLNLIESSLTDGEAADANAISQTKFASPQWTRRR